MYVVGEYSLICPCESTNIYILLNVSPPEKREKLGGLPKVLTLFLLRFFLSAARSGFNQLLPLPVHGDLHVLQLMVSQQLQDGENRQTDPDRQAAPDAELSGAELDVKAGRVDAVGLVDIVSGCQLARRESLGHALAPRHKAQSDDERGDQGDGGQDDGRDYVDERGEKRAVLAAIHQQGQPVDLHRRRYQEYQAYEYRVIAVHLRGPAHHELAVRLLPDSGREQETMSSKLLLVQAHRHDDADRQDKSHDVARYLTEQQDIRQCHTSRMNERGLVTVEERERVILITGCHRVHRQDLVHDCDKPL